MEPFHPNRAGRVRAAAAGAAAAARPRAIALRRPWPQGALTGLLLVAACCAAIVLLSWHLFGPVAPVAKEVPGADWSQVEALAGPPQG